jgi:2-oxoglutarate dehydrogenase E1 component
LGGAVSRGSGADEPLVSSLVSEPNKALFVDWSPYLGHRWDVASDTAVPLTELKALSEACNAVPDGFLGASCCEEVDG